ncbi:MAG: carbohydrate ABC transporter permease, partial [Victivallales bacterium]
LQPSAPSGPETVSLQKVWIEFVKKLPVNVKHLRSSEKAYQDYILAKYGSVENINRAYGWKLNSIEEAFPPFEAAYGITFRNNDWSFVSQSITGNYKFVVTFLLKRGRAILVTFLLVAFTILSVLTVNPLCAYALSRFSIKGKDKIILFLLAVTAFPAMVSAIPAYLLMRDLGLLNTFFALVLPHAAGGMAIFMLKGFFDSLPPELYEAATIDGASEFQNFMYVTLPLMKPILAVKVLGAFIGAYASWEWAIIICQNQKMWTISVWMYQASQWWVNTPWVISAGFVIVSIPILIVFLSCQKIILEGIILPQMK